MDYAIEQGDYQILKVKDRKTKKEIWIKAHMFNDRIHQKIKGENPMPKEYLEELFGDTEDAKEAKSDVGTTNDDQDNENVEMDKEDDQSSDQEDNEEDENDYTGMKKADLIVVAQQRGLEADPTMKNSEIIKLLKNN